MKTSPELVAFIREKLLYPERHRVTAHTEVESDLGVTGDDSPIFMEEFFNTFNVDPGDFDCSIYFEGEGLIDPFTAFFRFIFRKGKREAQQRVPLTVGMLQRAIDCGKWDSRRLSNDTQRR
ncbi:DUF1493 family protein [Burkholderia sp. 3C]